LTPVPVIDLFAGAGGLGEGFRHAHDASARGFEVRLSVEKESVACETLRLRSFFWQFPVGRAPDAYYNCLRGRLTRGELFSRFPEEAEQAHRETLEATLGAGGPSEAELDRRLLAAIDGAPDWVLVGGPPCQAYSIAGRSRNRAIASYCPENDERHYLYREYLRILGRYRPSVFVLENVKGMLSSRVGGTSIFSRMLEDLEDPSRALGGGSSRVGYRIYSLSRPNRGFDLFGSSELESREFVVEAERYGIPQKRHRVLLLGVRTDIRAEPTLLEPRLEAVTASSVLQGLPRLRSGLTDQDDSAQAWQAVVSDALRSHWIARKGSAHHRNEDLRGVAEIIERVIAKLRVPRAGRGGEHVRSSRSTAPAYRPDWYSDARLEGVCNHSARGHMATDLHRYLFASAFAAHTGRSPLLGDFPAALHPDHGNLDRALDSSHFSDRFKVQVAGSPSATVMSHIAKDGHYYIHFDPSQCRSLTVREAARLQTFPDNYYFCGNRTEQYVQVGNAVPPMLAADVARIVMQMLRSGAGDRARTSHGVARESRDVDRIPSAA
jgi:DNA (cytosine-5)-methyltransferase 1